MICMALQIAMALFEDSNYLYLKALVRQVMNLWICLGQAVRSNRSFFRPQNAAVQNSCTYHCYAWLVAVENMHSGSKTTKNSMEFPTLPVVNEGRAVNKTLCFIKPVLLLCNHAC